MSKILTKIALSIKNDRLYNCIDSFLLKDTVPTNLDEFKEQSTKIDLFFQYLEEKFKKHQNTKNSEKLFISLIKINNYNVDIINKFLTICHKSNFELIKELCNNNQYDILIYYIKKLLSHNTVDIFLPEIIKSVIENCSNIGNFTEIIITIASGFHKAEFTEKYICPLLNNSGQDTASFNKSFRNFILGFGKSTFIIQVNYCNYLWLFDKETFFSFEKTVLESCTGSNLIYYLTFVPNSSKRLILQHLIKLKDEYNLLRFIEVCPEFKHLLPML